MSVLDTAKLIRKAQQAKTSMKKVQAAGKSKSGLVAILINGLNEILEVSIDDSLCQNGSCATLSKEIIEAHDDARKELEKEMASSMDMDSIRDMLGA